MTIDSDTIFAVASGAGRAGVAVLRISGNRAEAILLALIDRLPPPRRASLRTLRDQSGALLDQAIVLWFPLPSSYTGESCVELHLHGSIAVVDAVSDTLVTLGARPAEPGEFTRRAFLNGQMDLTEAEAVADIIDAETSAQRVQALKQLGGGLSRTLEEWRTQLVALMAQQEALVDFPDEELPPDIEAALIANLGNLRDEIASYLSDNRRGERLRAGITIVVTGQPNVGKTSLVNYLAKRDVGIVSPRPGTTRDTLEARLIIAGVPVTLVDTAGIRETDDPIEAEGIRRATGQIETADIVLSLSDQPGNSNGLRASRDGLPPQSTIEILTKADLHRLILNDAPPLPVSLVSGEGLRELESCLEAEVRRLTQSGTQAPLTRARHRAALTETHDFLVSATTSRAELRAEDLRMSLRSLGRISGSVGVEEILSQVFSQFCIGK